MAIKSLSRRRISWLLGGSVFFVRAVLAMAGGAATGINPDYPSCLPGRWHA